MVGVEGTYNDKVVRQFAVMTVVWGIVGMLVGVIIAAQLYWPGLDFDLPWLSYGRLRPLHTNAVIFAFGGSALFATSLYVVQRTCHVRLLSDKLAAFVFWGWQLVIAAAAITLPLGMTQGKEYAELEWPIDVLITIVWVAYAVLFFGTIAKRKVKHIYVITHDLCLAQAFERHFRLVDGALGPSSTMHATTPEAPVLESAV